MEQLPDQVSSRQLTVYGYPFVIILGTIGNVLSIIVMMRKGLRNQTTSLFLVVLAVTDTAMLFGVFLNIWTEALNGLNLSTFTQAGCKIYSFFGFFLRQFQAWILTAVSVERFAVIFVPLKAKSVFTRKFAVVELAVIGVVLVGVNAPTLWVFEIISSPLTGGTTCFPSLTKYVHFSSSIQGWLDLCMASLAPFVLMLTLNLAIIGKLMYLNNQREKNLNSKKHSVQMTSMTMTLLTVTFTFFITTLPLAFMYATRSHWEAQLETFEDVAQYQLIWSCTIFVASLNNAMNFPLYCLSGRKFRRELLSMLGIRKGTVAPEEQTNTVVELQTQGTVQNVA